jgi:molybdate transport system substrate-binding protein
VLLGEADAAVVYETDTRIDGLRVLPLPDELQIPADYSAAAVSDSTVRPQALDFVDFLGTLEGLACLAAVGLGPPAP